MQSKTVVELLEPHILSFVSRLLMLFVLVKDKKKNPLINLRSIDSIDQETD